MIFDLDGTIADTHPMAVELIGESIVAGGGPILADDEIVALFGPNEKGIFRDVVGDGWEIAWHHYVSSYVERHAMCPRPFPGIEELLESFSAGAGRLGVVTGKTAETGNMSLEVLGIAHLVSDLRGGASSTVTKRSDITAIISRWGIPAANAVYVGDTPSDMIEARAAGVGALAAAWARHADLDALAAVEPDELFTDVAELTAWVAARLADQPPLTSTARNE
jgi:phosphoglycolate phosphatase/pyrophosphatase PpaX